MFAKSFGEGGVKRMCAVGVELSACLSSQKVAQNKNLECVSLLQSNAEVELSESISFFETALLAF